MLAPAVQSMERHPTFSRLSGLYSGTVTLVYDRSKCTPDCEVCKCRPDCNRPISHNKRVVCGNYSVLLPKCATEIVLEKCRHTECSTPTKETLMNKEGKQFERTEQH